MSERTWTKRCRPIVLLIDGEELFCISIEEAANIVSCSYDYMRRRLKREPLFFKNGCLIRKAERERDAFLYEKWLEKGINQEESLTKSVMKMANTEAIRDIACALGITTKEVRRIYDRNYRQYAEEH